MLLATAQATRDDLKTFEVEFPQHLTKFKMVTLPEGKLGNKTIKSFSISETEIPWEVFEIWALRLDTTTADQVADPQSKGADAKSRPSRPYAAIFIGFGHHTFPAICVSAFNAESFCKWLNQRTGKKFRLPTVDEWQYAAGAAPANIDEAAWTWENGDDTTHPVGTKKPNAFGLKDMLGNAAEWAKNDKGEMVVCGGSIRDKQATITPQTVAPYTPKWNEADPQNPKSIWWLANGQHVGVRIVCEN